MPLSNVSALVIAKNEERDLPGCLESLKDVASEIVVLIDETTTDRTEELARAAGAKVARRSFDDYARQRQAALELCTKEWVLWIDADERLDAILKEDLAMIFRGGSRGETTHFELSFKVRFLGRDLEWGGLGGEKHVRLFRRDKARFVGGALHEGLALEGGRAILLGHVEHEPYKDLSEYLEKLDRYTTLAARKKRAAGVRFRAWHHLVLPWELFRRVVLRAAFLDGWQGLTWAGLSAFHHWLKYVKLRELECSEPR